MILKRPILPPHIDSSLRAVLDAFFHELVLAQEPRSTAAPTSGKWERGQRVWNSTPSAGGYVGWVCTTSGTPGTWKGFGSIEA